MAAAEPWGHSPAPVPLHPHSHSSFLGLGASTCARAGDAPREPWLSSAPTAGAASPPRRPRQPLGWLSPTANTTEKNPLRHPQPAMGCAGGGPVLPPPIFIWVTREKLGSVAAGGFPLLSGKPLQQCACCRRKGQVSRAGEMDVPWDTDVLWDTDVPWERDVPRPREALGQPHVGSRGSHTFNNPRQTWDTAFPVRGGGGKITGVSTALFSLRAKLDFAGSLPRPPSLPP